jgi:hypothetical protein
MTSMPSGHEPGEAGGGEGAGVGVWLGWAVTLGVSVGILTSVAASAAFSVTLVGLGRVIAVGHRGFDRFGAKSGSQSQSAC